MIVLEHHGIVFVENAKAASRSIRAAISPWATEMYSAPLGLLHMNGTAAREHYPQLLSFGVVREPLDWLTSYWQYTRGELKSHEMEAEEFAQRYLGGENLWPEPYRTQTENLEGCDVIFSMDHLEHLWDWLRYNGLPVVEHHTGLSDKRKSNLKEETKEEVYKVLKSDLALYNKVVQVNEI